MLSENHIDRVQKGTYTVSLCDRNHIHGVCKMLRARSFFVKSVLNVCKRSRTRSFFVETVLIVSKGGTYKIILSENVLIVCKRLSTMSFFFFMKIVVIACKRTRTRSFYVKPY